MDKLHFVRKTTNEETIVRDEELKFDSTQKYYKDITEALHIDDFPLICVNTIEKKTYMMQLSGGQCYLVFNHYLLECMHVLNQFVCGKEFSKPLESFFYKIVSEECYNCNRILTAITFAGKYIEHIDEVIQQYLEAPFLEQIPDYLFVQQSFLIAHELFHFYLHRNPESYDKGLNSKTRYLKSIYEYVNNKHTEVAGFIEKAIKSPTMIEECLCDSTALIQAIDVGIKIGKLDVVESGISVAIALMNQYIISTIQDTVKHVGEISYEGLQNLFNFRLQHIKMFTEQYIKKYYSKEESQIYQEKVESIQGIWLNKVFTPVMYLLVDISPILKESQVCNSKTHEEIKDAENVLKKIYNMY